MVNSPQPWTSMQTLIYQKNKKNELERVLHKEQKWTDPQKYPTAK